MSIACAGRLELRSSEQIMATLPHEILDHILDYLHDDPRTLGLCALASRVLLQTSRYHRFNGLHIGLHNIRIIMPLLNASPDLAQTITSLTMSSASRSPVSHEILSTLQSLPALTKISVWIHRLPVTAYLGHLTSLCLMGNRVFWCSRRELLCGVSSCALLKELMLIHVFLSVENPENFECNDPPAPSLHKLHIQGGECAATISHWLAAGGVTPHHSLTFTVKDRLSAANLMGSSEALSNLVQKLEVRFMPDGSMSGTCVVSIHVNCLTIRNRGFARDRYESCDFHGAAFLRPPVRLLRDVRSAESILTVDTDHPGAIVVIASTDSHDFPCG